MKKFITLTIIAVMFAVGNSYAQNANADLNASATVNAALTIAESAPLAFGNVVQNTTPSVAFNGANAGVLAITGQEGQSVYFSTPASITLSNTGDTASMTVGSLTYGTSTNVDPEVSTAEYTINTAYPLSAGTNYLSVGGTLTVGEAQTAGSYTGTLAVTVSYSSF